MTEMKKEKEAMAMAMLRARVALLMSTPGWYEVVAASEVDWPSWTRTPPSAARALSCVALSRRSCSLLRKRRDWKVGRVMGGVENKRDVEMCLATFVLDVLMCSVDGSHQSVL